MLVVVIENGLVVVGEPGVVFVPDVSSTTLAAEAVAVVVPADGVVLRFATQ